MPSEFWGKQRIVENKVIKEDTLKSKLEVMGMKELRAYVKEHNLEAKDTDKSELIEEILKEVN